MMAVLRANNVHDWAANFLLALAPDAEGQGIATALDDACLRAAASLDRLNTIGASLAPVP
jgi:hypothetical protein